MTYMILERFQPSKVKELYLRFDQKGRMLPDGVSYIDSWIDQDVKICFQLMESDSREKLDQWIALWKDLADFQVFPVINSQQARKKVFSS